MSHCGSFKKTASKYLLTSNLIVYDSMIQLSSAKNVITKVYSKQDVFLPKATAPIIATMLSEFSTGS